MARNDLQLKNHLNLSSRLLFLLLIFIQSCGQVVKKDKIPMNWSNFNLDLPEGIEVYLGVNKNITAILINTFLPAVSYLTQKSFVFSKKN